MGMSFDERALSDRIVAACERYAHLVAILVVTKAAYGDVFEAARRRRPMTIASELAWGLAPPLVFATDGLALAAMLEPCYDNGGDALDYAVNDRLLHIAVFDAMGHGLAAAGVAAFALSAYRQQPTQWPLAARDVYLDARRGRKAIPGQPLRHSADRPTRPRHRAADLAQRRSPASTGDPRGRHARTLQTTPAPPLGVQSPSGPPTLARDSLEPADLLLLYTDGLTEARTPDGELFTIERLAQFIEHEAAAGQIAPETLRRLRQAVIGAGRAARRRHRRPTPVARRGETALLPQTVL